MAETVALPANLVASPLEGSGEDENPAAFQGDRMKTPAAGYVEVEVDTSKFEEIAKDIYLCLPEPVPFAELVRVLKLGFLLKPELEPALRANNALMATFQPLDFLIELLPALRAGELTFGSFKSILEAKSRIWDETRHD